MESQSVDINSLKVHKSGNCELPTPENAKPQEVGGSPTTLYFTYSVQWVASEVSWASRWDIYLRMTDVEIHWFSIFNSLVVVAFLFGIIILILCIINFILY